MRVWPVRMNQQRWHYMAAMSQDTQLLTVQSNVLKLTIVRTSVQATHMESAKYLKTHLVLQKYRNHIMIYTWPELVKVNPVQVPLMELPLMEVPPNQVPATSSRSWIPTTMGSSQDRKSLTESTHTSMDNSTIMTR